MIATLSGPMLPPKSGTAPGQAMVLLHGYGSDGTDLIGLGRYWRDLFPDMLFVSPNAPDVCAENPMGFEWFPLAIDRLAGRMEGAAAARPVIVSFLIDLWAQTGLSAKDTILCGFSQGAMMALHVGASLDQPLCGVVAFSGAFIPPEGFGQKPFAKPPVCLVHGDMDGVVDPDLSREAAEVLSRSGFEVSYHVSRGVAHGIAPDGLDFASSFMLALLAAKV